MTYVRANLPLSPVVLIPEIRLHQALPTSQLKRLPGARLTRQPPYWAFAWDGGLALARYILDNKEAVAGRRVLDLGTGSGLVAIAAAKARAATVTAADIDPQAVAAARLNALENGVSISVIHADPTRYPVPPVDIILLGDVFYDPDLTDGLVPFLDRCLGAGIQVLVGDPSRGCVPEDRLDPLARYAIRKSAGQGTSSAGVFAFTALSGCVPSATSADASRRTPLS